jgi:hypothetical protein
MKILTAILFALLASPSLIWATAQIGEFLDFEGKREEMYATPLESYFTHKNMKPEFPIQSSGCWRGYIGLWSLKDNQLSLQSLHEWDHEKEDPLGKKISLKPIFGSESSPVKADWFTGVIRLPRGKELRYVHMGFGTIFEKDIYLTIQKGRLVARREINNTEIGATRSTSDLQWVAMATSPAPDEGNWTDARTLLDSTTAKDHVTRGIYFTAEQGQSPRLWIPDTPTTPAVDIELNLQAATDIPAGSHVEIKGRFDPKDQKFRVTSLRQLKAGETMHHPKFVEPKVPKQ